MEAGSVQGLRGQGHWQRLDNRCAHATDSHGTLPCSWATGCWSPSFFIFVFIWGSERRRKEREQGRNTSTCCSTHPYPLADSCTCPDRNNARTTFQPMELPGQALNCIFDVCMHLTTNWFLNPVDRLKGLKSFHYTSFQLSTCQLSHHLSRTLAMHCEFFQANDVKRIWTFNSKYLLDNSS